MFLCESGACSFLLLKSVTWCGCAMICLSVRSLKDPWIVSVFLKDFIYLFLERGEGREKERERNINVWLPLVCPTPGTWPATQACVLTGN